jgi:adenine deaminase
MAKSIRSKGKRSARAIRRKDIHSPVEKKRLERLTESLKTIKTHIPPNFNPNAPVEEQKIEEVVEILEDKVLTRDERQKLFLNRNQFKKKKKASLLSQKNKKKKKSTLLSLAN